MSLLDSKGCSNESTAEVPLELPVVLRRFEFESRGIGRSCSVDAQMSRRGAVAWSSAGRGSVKASLQGWANARRYDCTSLPSVRHAMTDASTADAKTIYDFDAISIQGQPAQLSTQRGKVMLIVNTASACGFTPQFAGLESLWEKYRDKGLVVMGFPSNEFGGQDPGTDGEIASFCEVNYGVTFPMMGKVKVNGSGAHPLWQWLTKEAPGILGSKSIKWNFTKFLVDRSGKVLKRYAPTDKPESIEKDIEAALAA